MNKRRMCRVEQLFITLGFRLIHDGERNPDRFEFQPEDIKFFTRKYRLFMDGKPQGTWATFKYDERSKYVDFEVYIRDPDEKNVVQESRRQKYRLSPQESQEVFNAKD